MNGILLVDKPKGWTSFDVVNKVRYTVQHSELNTSNKKRFPVGHTGTLDPLATGLLVLLLGTYTKKAPELTKLDKTYEVTMMLGQTSTTGDEEGEKTVISERIPESNEISQVLQEFTGEIQQIPPAFSAVKVHGKRAYKLARQGKAVKLEPRKVHIYKTNLDSYEYPFVRFTTEVNSGTYIRSLVQDIGEKLGTGAYMSDLRRTKVGKYKLINAYDLAQLDQEQLFSNVITVA